MIKEGRPLTVIIILVALGISFFLWSIGVYFFFLPIIFLPFLRFLKIKQKRKDGRICPVCKLASDGNFCPRCGEKLS